MESLIEVKQLPVIEEHLRTLKDYWEQMALDAESMVCTDETIQTVKAFRADMRKEFDRLEEQRKQVKKAVMGPYEQFEAVYNDCVTNAFKEADNVCSSKIYIVEADMKKRCENGLRDYFSELCAVYHLDWLVYERAGIKVDMASARAKTPKKLREQLSTFVSQVACDVDRISRLDDAEEIMVEFRKSLNATEAIYTVADRHRSIEQERAAQEAGKAVLEQEVEAVRRVDALASPVAIELPKTVKCTFTVRTTMDKLKKLKEFLNMEGIQYE